MVTCLFLTNHFKLNLVINSLTMNVFIYFGNAGLANTKCLLCLSIMEPLATSFDVMSPSLGEMFESPIFVEKQQRGGPHVHGLGRPSDNEVWDS